MLVSGFAQTAEEWEIYNERSGRSFPEYIYFIIITLSTVGYGDITPVTWQGKLFVILLTLYFTNWFASNLDEFTENVFEMYYKCKYRLRSRHNMARVTITGIFSVPYLVKFLKEFLDKRRDESNYIDVAILIEKVEIADHILEETHGQVNIIYNKPSDKKLLLNLYENKKIYGDCMIILL